MIFGYFHVPFGTQSSPLFQWIRFVQSGLFAIGITWLYRKTRNIFYPILAHFLWNLQKNFERYATATGFFDVVRTLNYGLILLGLIICVGYLLYRLKTGNRKQIESIYRQSSVPDSVVFLMIIGIFVSVYFDFLYYLVIISEQNNYALLPRN